MNCAIIYFSGTGNTEYVANIIKGEIEKNNIDVSLINIDNNSKLENIYDIYIFGCPIYAGLFPQYYIQWIKNNVPIVDNKKTMIFSTQGSNSGQGVNQLEEILFKKGFSIFIKELIEMPNNYYLGAGFKPTEDDKKVELKKYAQRQCEVIIEKFLKGESKIYRSSKVRYIGAKLMYSVFAKISEKWAKSNLTVNFDKCIKCEKCVKDCPVNNIQIDLDKNIINFNEMCIGCQRCVHKCPTNAFLYKGKDINQYKL